MTWIRWLAVFWLIVWPSTAQAKKPMQPAGPFLPTGTILRVTITNAIFSFNLATPVIAELDEDASFNKGGVVFPKKTRFLGQALVLKSHDRVNITFSLAVLPDGKEIKLTGLALSPDGSAGIQGKVDKQKDSAIASAALKGAIMGAAAITSQADDSITAQASQSAAQETANAIDTSTGNIDTSIWIPAFTRCLMYLNRRVDLSKKDNGLN